MPRRTPMILAGAFLVPVAIVFILLKLSPSVNERENGFSRVFIENAISFSKRISSTKRIVELIGEEQGRVYFRGENPKELYAWNYLKSDSIVKWSSSPGKEIPKDCYVEIHSSKLYYFTYNLHSVVIYDIQTHTFKNLPVGNVYSSKACVDTNLLFIRIADRDRKNRIFAKVNINSGYMAYETGISPRLNDGGLLADGILNYDRLTQQLVYTYIYANGYTCFDTSFKNLYTGRTIDTNTHFLASVENVGHSVTHATPPIAVSIFSCVDNGYLYVYSGLRADNEDVKTFKSLSTIDVYDLQSKKYRYSFHVPDGAKKMSRFLVSRNLLIGVFDNEIHLFELRLD